MLSSFYTAISGLNANSRSLGVIGNNLANMNTVGYKSSTMSFRDMLGATLSFNGAGEPIQIGLGVQTSSVTNNFSQGSLQSTSQPSDVAIVGNGFFIVNNGEGNFYTRAGNFTLNAQGYLTTQSGHRVQGYPAVDGVVQTDGALTDLRVDPGLILPAEATTLMRLVSNLDAELPVGESFTSSVQMVDSLGVRHSASVTFTRAAGSPPSFSFDITVEGADVVGGTAGVPFSLLTGADAVVPSPGTIAFDADGRVASVDSGTGPVAPPADFTLTTPVFTSGASAQTVTFDLVSPSGDAYITGFAAPSATASTFQDGTTAANLLSFTVATDGTVQGIFANGQTAPLGQIALATFNNPNGLIKVGDNMFNSGFNAGEPSIGTPGAGGRGATTGGALELSNVDLATEFTSLIVAQRGYQANSKVITTTDELIQEAINLKR